MYVKKTVKYGNRIYIRKYHTCRYNVKGEKRSKREKATPEAVKRNNERQAVIKLNRLLVNNFDLGDWHLILTYSDKKRPGSADEARNIYDKFMRKLRREYKKAGEELKYIAVAEYESTNIHHHIVINDIKGIAKILKKIWPGGMHLTPLYEDKNYKGLAQYLIKETKNTFRSSKNAWKQRYTCSRNLVKPIVKIERIRRSNTFSDTPSMPDKYAAAGYVLDKESIASGFDFLGYEFIEYEFVKYNDE